MLMRAIAVTGEIKLLIVDPIVSAVAGDSHKNAEVRRGLQPLVDAGQKLGAAVLGISHFSKGTAGRDVTERVTGSLAFGALARVVLAAAKRSEDDGGGRILARAKSNIGPDGGGFAYDLAPGTIAARPDIAVHVLQWGAAIEGSARELLASADDTGDSEERTAFDDAKGFLQGLPPGVFICRHHHAPAIRARMASTFQAVQRAEIFTAGGYLPDLTPAHHVDLLTGITAGIGGSAFALPIICGRRR